MRFLTGNAGIVVVIVAIMGTVAVGYILAGDTETETATEFQHTADITGLFATSNEPEYLDYSPPENWTGWRTGNYYMQGVDYEQSTRATPYIVPQMDHTNLVSATLSGGSAISGLLYYGEHLSDRRTSNPYSVALTDWLDGLTLNQNAIEMEISLAVNGPVLSRSAVFSDGSTVAVDTGVIRAVVELNDVDRRTALYGHNGVFVGSFTASQLYFFYGSDLPSSATNYVPGDIVDYYTILDMPIIYMDASAGVQIVGNTVNWINGYDNAGITLAFERPGMADIAFTLDGKNIRIYVNANDVTATVNSTTVMVQQLGSWQHFAISLDLQNGKISFIPIVQWVSFLDWTGAPATSYDLGAAGTVDRLVFRKASGTDMRLGITSTVVYMDTTKVVMKDPAITITDYWPDADGRIQFNGFAMYGDSVTINGQTYAVDDGLITIGDRTTELSNLTITWLDGHVTAQIGQATFDLGETVTHAVSFGGVWYFTASYWEAHEVTKEIYNWTTGMFRMGSEASILVYIGLLFAGTAILHRAQGLHGGDLLIIACAGVVGYVLLDMMA